MQLAWGTPKMGFNAVNPNASLSGYIINPNTGKLERCTVILTLKSAHYNKDMGVLYYKVNKLMFAHTFTKVSNTLVVQQPTLFIDVFGPGDYP